jgi:hypothetical protein
MVKLMNQHQTDTRFSVSLLAVCRLRYHHNLHTANTHPTHEIAPNSNCVEPPEDGRVTPETCTGIDS